MPIVLLNHGNTGAEVPCPKQWQRAWLQKYLAAQMARSAQTIKPTADDIAIAMLRYGEAQSEADAEYERRTGVSANPRRWEKRD